MTSSAHKKEQNDGSKQSSRRLSGVKNPGDYGLIIDHPNSNSAGGVYGFSSSESDKNHLP
jgi:hypothetical protein